MKIERITGNPQYWCTCVCVYKKYYRRNHELVKGMEEVRVGESDGNDLNTVQVEILKN